jgi:hypothetical protein
MIIFALINLFLHKEVFVYAFTGTNIYTTPQFSQETPFSTPVPAFTAKFDTNSDALKWASALSPFG